MVRGRSIVSLEERAERARPWARSRGSRGGLAPCARRLAGRRAERGAEPRGAPPERAGVDAVDPGRCPYRRRERGARYELAERILEELPLGRESDRPHLRSLGGVRRRGEGD